MRSLTPAREAVLAGLAVLVLHWLVRLQVTPGAFQDDAIYLALGQALADGEGWRSIYAAGSPVHLKYPPGLPALYAAAWLLGGTLARTVAIVGALHLVVAGTCGALLWWIVRARLRLSPIAAAVAVLTLALVSVVDHWQLAIAEGPFVAVWLGVIALALSPLTARRAVALGLLLAGATLLRTQGWAVSAGLMIALLAGHRDRRLVGLTMAVAVAPLLAWWVVHAGMVARGPLSTQPDEVGYLAVFRDLTLGRLLPALATGFGLNVSAYWRIIPRELGPAGPGHLLVLAGVGLTVLGAVAGGRRLLPLSLTLGTSALLVVCWPYTQARFVVALIPIAGLLIVHGWNVLAVRLPPRGGLLLATALIMTVAIRQPAVRHAAHAPDAVSAVGFQPVGRTLEANSEWLDVVAPWVRTETSADARILTEGAAGLWLATGRAGVAALPATPNFLARATAGPPDVGSRLVEDGITVVIASSPPVYAGVAAVEQSCPGSFRRGERIREVAVAFVVNDSTRACVTGIPR